MHIYKRVTRNLFSKNRTLGNLKSEYFDFDFVEVTYARQTKELFCVALISNQ